MKTLTIDGLRVPNVSDEAEAAITKLQDQLAKANEAKDKALADVATLQTDKATLETEKTTLETKLKDAEVTPQQLRDAAKSYALTVDKAKALGVAVTDEMSEADIRKAVVSAKMGDAAKDWDDKQIAASFAVLAKDAKVETHTAPSGAPVSFGDAQADYAKARDARRQALSDAWKAPSTAAA